MAIIGTFTQRDAQFIGTVRTLILNEEITLIPIEKNSEAAPDYRAVAGQIEIGAAWRKTSKQQNDYLLVKLDDPSFDAPLVARVVKMAEGWRLLWSR